MVIVIVSVLSTCQDLPDPQVPEFFPETDSTDSRADYDHVEVVPFVHFLPLGLS